MPLRSSADGAGPLSRYYDWEPFNLKGRTKGKTPSLWAAYDLHVEGPHDGLPREAHRPFGWRTVTNIPFLAGLAAVTK